LIDYDEGRIAEQMSQLGKRLLSIPQLYQNDREKKAVEGLIHRVVNSV
jgi:hypothetical protein